MIMAILLELTLTRRHSLYSVYPRLVNVSLSSRLERSYACNCDLLECFPDCAPWTPHCALALSSVDPHPLHREARQWAIRPVYLQDEDEPSNPTLKMVVFRLPRPATRTRRR